MELTPDVWHPWTLKSENISFEGDTSRKIGSGELKIASELDINTITNRHFCSYVH